MNLKGLSMKVTVSVLTMALAGCMLTNSKKIEDHHETSIQIY